MKFEMKFLGKRTPKNHMIHMQSFKFYFLLKKARDDFLITLLLLCKVSYYFLFQKHFLGAQYFGRIVFLPSQSSTRKS